MFLYSKKLRRNKTSDSSESLKINEILLRFRMQIFSPLKNLWNQGIGTFFFAPLKAALTVEAAIVLPLFLFCMIAAWQYGLVMETAVKCSAALAETGKKMAMTAYVSKYGGDTGKVTEFIAGALSAAYAQHEVLEKAGDNGSIQNANMLLSSFLQEDEMIDLALTYQIRTPVSMVSLPGTFFIQRAQVRAWTGRVPPSSGQGDGEEAKNSQEMVYVTATGSVYHEDADCTHLKLSTRPVMKSQLSTVRNNSGGIYHACEKCKETGESVVFITKEGNRYHSSLECSGLKRTVRQVTREEVSSMRSCSKCGHD